MTKNETNHITVTETENRGLTLFQFASITPTKPIVCGYQNGISYGLWGLLHAEQFCADYGISLNTVQRFDLILTGDASYSYDIYSNFQSTPITPTPYHAQNNKYVIPLREIWAQGKRDFIIQPLCSDSENVHFSTNVRIEIQTYQGVTEIEPSPAYLMLLTMRGGFASSSLQCGTTSEGAQYFTVGFLNLDFLCSKHDISRSKLSRADIKFKGTKNQSYKIWTNLGTSLLANCTSENNIYKVPYLDVLARGDGSFSITDVSNYDSFNLNDITIELDFTENVTVDTISITKLPARTVYTTNESFSPAGMTVIATYTDGTTKNVTPYITCSTDRPFSSVGTYTVTISFWEKTATLSVIVADSIEPIPGTNSPKCASYTRNYYLENTESNILKNLCMDIKIPNGCIYPIPAVVTIHGGSWKLGSRDKYYGVQQNSYNITPFLLFCGVAHVSIDYRLLGNCEAECENASETDYEKKKAPYLKMLDDIDTALDYIEQNFKNVIDSNQLALMGYSAGAHLAMLYAYSRNDSRIKLVVSEAGPTDLRESPDNSDLFRLIGKNPIEETEDVLEQALYDASPINKADQNTSPYSILAYGYGYMPDTELNSHNPSYLMDGLIPLSEGSNLEKKLHKDNCSFFSMYPLHHSEFDKLFAQGETIGTEYLNKLRDKLTNLKNGQPL